MNNSSDDFVQQFGVASKRMALAFLVAFLDAALISLVYEWVHSGPIEHLKTGNQWLEIIFNAVAEVAGIALLAFAYLALGILLVVPGLLFLCFQPELGHAWLRGINPIWYRKSWQEMSNFAKLYTFFHAIVFFIFGVLFAYQIILNTFFK